MADHHVTIPFSYHVVGTRKRARIATAFNAVGHVLTKVASIDSSETDAQLEFDEWGPGSGSFPESDARLRRAFVVDGSIYLPAVFGASHLKDLDLVSPSQMETWSRSVLENGFGSESFSAGCNPLVVELDMPKGASAPKSTLVLEKAIAEIEASDYDERQEAAIRTGKALLVIDGAVYSRRWEPTITPSGKWHRDEVLEPLRHIAARWYFMNEEAEAGSSVTAFDEREPTERWLRGDLSTVEWKYDAQLASTALMLERLFSSFKETDWSKSPASPLVASRISSAVYGMLAAREKLQNGECDTESAIERIIVLREALWSNSLTEEIHRHNLMKIDDFLDLNRRRAERLAQPSDDDQLALAKAFF